MSKICKEALKTTYEELVGIKEALEAVKKYDDSYSEDIRRSITYYKNQWIIGKINTISIDEFYKYKSGIRLAALHAAGIHTIGQLRGRNINELIAIPGIGPESAQKLKQYEQQVYQEIGDQFYVSFAENDKNQLTEYLVKRTYAKINNKENCKKVNVLLNENFNKMKRIEELKKSQTFWNSFLSTKEERTKKEKEILSFCAECKNGYSWQVDSVLAEFSSFINAEKDTCWADFVSDAASYIGYIDVASKGLNILRRKQPDNSGGNNQMAYSSIYKRYSTIDCSVRVIPEELIQEIDKFQIDLDLMNTELRRYQLFGAKYILNQKRVLLGDEMGLGKTVEAIAVITHLMSQMKRKILVICPLSVLINWEREIRKHANVDVVVLYGIDSESKFDWWLDNHSAVGLATYESIQRVNATLIESLDLLVVDEAHNVKNPNATRTQKIISLVDKSEHVLYMTGTPLENKLSEMQFLLSCINPKFKSTMIMGEAVEPEVFKEMIVSTYLRRIREDVLAELPELIEVEDWLEMNSYELEAYKNSLSYGTFMSVRRISWNIDIKDSSKFQRLVEICDEAEREKRRIIVFSFFRDTLSLVSAALQDRCVGVINGSISANVRQEIIDRFSKSPYGSVLVSQVEAGGVGLNIQAASVVVFCEPQYKPSTENQAISRAYRMGQINNVIVHRLLMLDSVDERLMDILNNKSRIFDLYAEESKVGKTDILKNEKAVFKAIVEEERKKYAIKAIPDNQRDSFVDGRNEEQNNGASVVEETIFTQGCYLVGDELEIGKYILYTQDTSKGSFTIYNTLNDYRNKQEREHIEFSGDYYLALRTEGEVITTLNVNMKKSN